MAKTTRASVKGRGTDKARHRAQTGRQGAAPATGAAPAAPVIMDHVASETLSERGARRIAGRFVPKFSFIVPLYMPPGHIGAALSFGRCWQSILDQTDPSWEAIIVHDGPSAAARRAIEEGARRDCLRIGRPHAVRYIEAPYVGIRGGHQSVEVGKHLATGEFICILNGDNTLRQHYIESMYDADADILIGSVRMNDMPGHILNGRAWNRGGIDRLNYAIRTGIATQVRHKQHLDADYDFLIDCWTYRDSIAGEVRVRYVEQVVAEHN